MTVEAGRMLVEEIAPRLKTATAYIKPVGCEDREELYQDGLALAAKMLHDLEQRGKTVTPGNVAYYIVLHLKSGRRSYGCGRTDAMFSSTQLDGKSQVLSFETEIGFDPETQEAICLGELLTGSQDDPSMTAGRNLDWEKFISSHDYRYGVILKDFVEGRTVMDRAKENGERYSQVRKLKEKMEQELREFMGPEAVADAGRTPKWKGDILAGRERAACKRH
jgi:hypothetical protein